MPFICETVRSLTSVFVCIFVVWPGTNWSRIFGLLVFACDFDGLCQIATQFLNVLQHTHLDVVRIYHIWVCLRDMGILRRLVRMHVKWAISYGRFFLQPIKWNGMKASASYLDIPYTMYTVYGCSLQWHIVISLAHKTCQINFIPQTSQFQFTHNTLIFRSSIRSINYLRIFILRK